MKSQEMAIEVGIMVSELGIEAKDPSNNLVKSNSQR